jgi:hypothetical protein
MPIMRDRLIRCHRSNRRTLVSPYAEGMRLAARLAAMASFGDRDAVWDLAGEIAGGDYARETIGGLAAMCAVLVGTMAVLGGHAVEDIVALMHDAAAEAASEIEQEES